MNKTKIDWNDLNFFLAVAKGGGLSPGAKIALRSPATLGRRMRLLERSLGVELFIRHERGYEMTEEGRKFLEKLSEIEASILRLTTKVDAEERPLVKISAGTWTTLALIEKLDDIAGVPNDVRIRFVSTERILDIARREVSIGFRNSRSTENTLAGRKLARVEFAPYASLGAPQRWIKVLSDTPSALWLKNNADWALNPMGTSTI